MSVFTDVRDFQTIAGSDRAPVPTVNKTVVRKSNRDYLLRDAIGWAADDAKILAEEYGTPELQRLSLLLEEVNETVIAILNGDVVETADGLADINYITNGTADTFGIPLDEIHDAVHATNMAKFPGGVKTVNDAGKILKPEGWVGPTQAIENVLTSYGWEKK